MPEGQIGCSAKLDSSTLRTLFLDLGLHGLGGEEANVYFNRLVIHFITQAT